MLGEALAGRMRCRLGSAEACVGSLRDLPGVQRDVDWFWDHWLQAAAVELEAKSGRQLGPLAPAYAFAEFDPARRLSTGTCARGGQVLPRPAYVVAWTLRRLQENVARCRDCRWHLVRPRHVAQLQDWTAAAPELRELRVAGFLARPWDFGVEVGLALVEECRCLLEKVRREEDRLSRSSWRDELDASAAAGTKRAFLHLKGADSAPPPHQQHGWHAARPGAAPASVEQAVAR